MADILFNLPSGTDRTYYSFTKELEGVTYYFTIQYLRRLDSFSLSIGEDDRSINIVGGVNLLQQIDYLPVPPGELRIFDYDGLNRDPTQETFGEKITLIYTESA